MNDKHNNKKALTVKNVAGENLDSKPNLQRRNALLGVATGASLLAWHKPLINAVVLPSHAQTSTDNQVDPVAAAFFGANVAAGPIASVNKSLLDYVIPQAIAGNASSTQNYTVSVASANTDNTSFTVALFEDLGATQGFDVAQVVYEGTVSTTSGGSLSPSDNPCELEGLEDITVEIAEVSENSVVLNLTSRSQSLTVPAGDGALPSAQCTGGPVARVFSIENVGASSMVTKNSSSLLDVLIPMANAGDPAGFERSFSALAEESAPGSNLFTITLLERIVNPRSQLFSQVESTYQDQIEGPGTGVIGLMAAGCDEAPMDDLNVEITSVTDEGLELLITSREVVLNLVPGAITIPAPSCERVPTAESYFQEGSGGLSPQEINFESLLDLVIPTAQAGGAQASDFGVLAMKMGDTQYSIELLNRRGTLIRTAILDIDGTQGSFTPNMPLTCPGEFEGTPRDIPAMITGIDEQTLSLQLNTPRNGTIFIDVPAGTGTLTEVCDIIIQD